MFTGKVLFGIGIGIVIALALAMHLYGPHLGRLLHGGR
jgi:hypothetical protein